MTTIMTACRRCLLLPLLAIDVPGETGERPQTGLVITHVTIIDATGAPAKPDMTVVIAADRIAALGKTAEVPVPKDARIVQAAGRFLIPGLWDMHGHLTYPTENPLALLIEHHAAPVDAADVSRREQRAARVGWGEDPLVAQ